MAPTAKPAEVRHIDPFSGYLASFELALQAENRSPNTIRMYRVALVNLRDYLAAQGRSTDPADITRDDMRAWIANLLATRTEATASGYFAGAHRFWDWLLLEEPDLIEHSPMERMHAPKVHEKPVDFLSLDELQALLRASAGSDFDARRDAAILRIGFDCGLRRSEFAWLALEDCDIPNHVLMVRGKGGHLASVYIGAKTAQALDRYLRMRARHAQAATMVERAGVNGERQHVHPLFLTRAGGLTSEGVADIVKRRAQQAGITRRVHPHLLRHSFADSLKASGASDEDVMRLGRWKDPRIMRKYASSAADRRAQATHARLSPGDRL